MSPHPEPHPLETSPRGLRRFVPSVRNVAASYLGAFAEAASFLLLTPFMVRELGLATFGLWSLATALAEWLQLLDFGIREAMLRYTSVHRTHRSTAGVRRVADTSMAVLSLSGMGSLVLALVLAFLLLPWVSPDATFRADLRSALLVLAFSTALSFPLGVAGTLLEGLARYPLINALRVGHAALRLVLVVLAVQLGGSLTAVALADFCARLTLHAARWLAVRGIHPDLLPRPVLHRDTLRHLAGFGLWSGLRQISEVAVSRFYEPILAIFSGPAAVGAFYAGRRLATLPAEMISPMTAVLFPLSSEMAAAQRSATLRQTLLSSTKFTFMIALPLSLIVALGAGPIQANWLGGRAPAAEAVMRVFALVFLLVAAGLPGEAILLGLGRSKLLAFSGLAQGLVTIGLGIPLTRRMGPLGLAVAALVATLFAMLGPQIPAATRACGLRLGTLVRIALLPPVLAGMPVALAMLLLRDRVAVGGLAALAAWSGGGVIGYAGLLWWTGFDADERAFFRSHLKRLVLDTSRIDDFE